LGLAENVIARNEVTRQSVTDLAQHWRSTGLRFASLSFPRKSR